MPLRLACLSLFAIALTASASAQPGQQDPPPQQPVRCNGEAPDPTCRRAPADADRRDRPDRNQLGGGDPGWEVGRPDSAARPDSFGGDEPTRVETPDPTNRLGGGDPGWEVQNATDTPDAGGFMGDEPTWVRPSDQTNQLGGGDPGWGVSEEPAAEDFTGDEPSWVQQPDTAAQETEPSQARPHTRRDVTRRNPDDPQGT